MGFSRQEYWSRLPFPPPGDLPNPGSNLDLLHCSWILYQLSHKESPSILEWVQFSSVQSLSCVPLFVTPWIAACQASLSFTISHSLLKFLSTELMMPSNQLIVCRLLSLPSVFPTIRVFSSESAPHIWWPKYWSFSVSPSNEYSGLISSRIDWFDLLAVQWTLKSLFQHNNLKASVLWRSNFTVQHCPRHHHPGSPALNTDSLPSEPPRKPWGQLE